MNRAEVKSEHRKEELRLKAEQLALQKQVVENQRLQLTQQQQSNMCLLENIKQQNALQQQQNQQFMTLLLNNQQQQAQLFNALIEKLNKN